MLGGLAIALVISAVAASAAELSIQPGVVAPGKPATLNVMLAAGQDAPTGIQFDLEYDAASLEVAIENGPAAGKAAKTLRTAMIQSGRQRALIIGFNKTIISDGVLAVLKVSYKGQETGKTFPIHIMGAAGTNEKAEPVAVTGKDGSVKVEIGRNAQ